MQPTEGRFQSWWRLNITTALILKGFVLVFGLLVIVNTLLADSQLSWSGRIGLQSVSRISRAVAEEKQQQQVLSESRNNTFATRCETLATLVNIPGVKVNILQYVSNGTTLSFPYDDTSCFAPTQLVYGGDVCRIGMQVATSNASSITLEAWLPANWNGRFLSAGNSGLAGCVQYYDIAYGTSYGFATVGTNNGHNGTDPVQFVNAPDVVEDFAYRSIHTGAVVGKQLTKLFYGSENFKSYYMGCSTGGRQGMKAAQSFPEDFDGIVAGAPAINFNRLIGWSAWLAATAGFDRNSTSFVTAGHWVVIHREVLRQCDGLDGAIDGIVEDPDLCHPIWTPLLCTADTTDKSTCLNPSQLSRVTEIFSPLYANSSILICPRLLPNSDLWALTHHFSGYPAGFVSWYAYAIFNDASWDPYSFSVADIAYADAIDPFQISTYSPDLSVFESRGGKLLVYHGMDDSSITPELTSTYYDMVALNMSMPPEELDSFFRYFRIGGMGHCQVGDGALDIGQGLISGGEAWRTRRTREDNVLLAIVYWVEKGIAPETIRGYRWVGGGEDGIDFSRKHCRYPRRNVYTGEMGKERHEDGWKCVF